MASDQTPLSTLIHMITIRLTASNYLLWRHQISIVLRCDGLLSIVDGTDLAPAPTLPGADGQPAPNPDHAKWTKRHDRALSLLLASLTEESMSEILGLTSAHEIWTALERVFCPSTQSRTHQLRDELQFLKRGSSTVADFSRKFNGPCHQLAAIGSPVSDGDKTRWFLRGLGSQFRNFSDICLAVSPTPNFADLVSRARDHELRHRLLADASDGTAPQAAFVAAQSQSHSNNGSRKNGRNNNSTGRTPSGSNNNGRGTYGHANQSTAPSSTGQPRRTFTPRCQICRGGHFADVCPERYKERQSQANLVQAFQNQCNVADVSSSDWYVDTGASAHMTASPSNLDTVEPYTESQDKGNSSTRPM